MRFAVPTLLASLVLLTPGVHLAAALGAPGVVRHALMQLDVVVIIYVMALQGLA